MPNRPSTAMRGFTFGAPPASMIPPRFTPAASSAIQRSVATSSWCSSPTEALRAAGAEQAEILAGLVVELVSLFWLHHPLGFMFFMFFGFSLTGAGLVMFIYHLLLIVRTAWQQHEADG